MDPRHDTTLSPGLLTVLAPSIAALVAGFWAWARATRRAPSKKLEHAQVENLSVESMSSIIRTLQSEVLRLENRMEAQDKKMDIMRKATAAAEARCSRNLAKLSGVIAVCIRMLHEAGLEPPAVPEMEPEP